MAPGSWLEEVYLITIIIEAEPTSWGVFDVLKGI